MTSSDADYDAAWQARDWDEVRRIQDERGNLPVVDADTREAAATFIDGDLPAKVRARAIGTLYEADWYSSDKWSDSERLVDALIAAGLLGNRDRDADIWDAGFAYRHGLPENDTLLSDREIGNPYRAAST